MGDFQSYVKVPGLSQIPSSSLGCPIADEVQMLVQVCSWQIVDTLDTLQKK